MTYETVLVERKDRVALVTLNRPKPSTPSTSG